MKRFNLNTTFDNIIFSILFWKIEFERKGLYERKVFLFYSDYREDYYKMMADGYRVHNLSNYGIITVWYYKPE
jgi:hypothetical protein